MTRTHVNTLDGLVTVNSLFTIAVFVGLSLEPSSTDAKLECYPNYDVQKNLFVFEILSFSFFLFSSLVAQGLKMALSLRNCSLTNEIYVAEIDGRILRSGMLGSAIGSMCGCFFLVMSVMDIIQIRLGYFTCGSSTAIWTSVLMVVFILTSLGLYICTVVSTVLQPLPVYDGNPGTGIDAAPPPDNLFQV
ncbi:maternal effect embryoarrest 60 [Zostera marina]|uniref:Maternal effect embryoarrest 60 n=1 Tax=Zostera marina TaxID=29655 RepID=A0A0K9PER4_ZOSMR|nr:maternal effect embryoarrest 60 [Zostera marina]